MSLFDEIDRVSSVRKRDQIVKPPFNYPGGKSRSVQQILPHLPYRAGYCEPFGGSAVVLLNRRPSKFEVYNDRYSGVVAFFQCMRDKSLSEQLANWLDLSLHAREDFVFCKETWKDAEDPVERAGRWYLMLAYSFGGLGRNWGRQLEGTSHAGKVRDRAKLFPILHRRLAGVQIENQDWEDCIQDYDNRDMVFYCDPPYLNVYTGTYQNELSYERHSDFLKLVFNCKAYFAVSGYSNPLYESQGWDHRFEWETNVSIKSLAYTESNGKEHLKGLEKRGKATEVLWIKEAR